MAPSEVSIFTMGRDGFSWLAGSAVAGVSWAREEVRDKAMAAVANKTGLMG